ncbi:VQ motif-containing protein 8, chloroplastic-like [Rutidosis leptorrhynchoides]|uniref:VQ motif-containing protein 8, chloroplastic-like n=1 Tax=Rutidosis leptorrhynchoides TaxID=125765 RepID=UPI003A9950DB
MSSRKFLVADNKQRTKNGVEINGPRPTPLKVRQESRTIQKHRPIIIYMHSPEVIHTKPHDFMALVQKLTGCSGSKDQDQNQDQRLKKTLKQEDGYDRNENEISNVSSVISKKDNIMKAKSPMFSMPSNPYMKDIPLFTPNSNNEYFYSPQRFFRYPDTVSSSSPNLSFSLSPGSIVEILKGLPEC